MPYGTIAADRITGTNGNSISPESSVFRNRIINGDMTIDQRNAGASVTATTANLYTVDRWQAFATQSSKYTVQQNAGSVSTPVGFTNYLGVTSSSAYSVAAGDYFMITQAIEGYNVADLGFGTASAKTVTLSFQVYSSLTGTFGGALTNNVINRSYPFTYTVSAANTWTTISVTVAGDTGGTWNKTTAQGLYVMFGLGAGSTYSGTAGSWAGAAYYTATGATSVVGTNGATFYITGVQLEAGSTATSYEYLSYGTELVLCQRYYQNTYDMGTGVGSNIADIRNALSAQTPGNNAGQALTLQVVHPVTMRVAPTVAVYDAAGNSNKFTGIASSTAQTNNVSISGGNLQINSSAKTTSFRSYDIAYYGFGIAATFTSEL